jgi:DNA-binding NarL/FixJ family response regulator
VLFGYDRPLLSEALRAVLTSSEFEVVAVARTAGQVLSLIDQTGPKLVLLDMSMPGISELRLLEEIAGHHPDLVVVTLDAIEQETIQIASPSDHNGYLLTVAQGSELGALLRQIASGGRPSAPR